LPGAGQAVDDRMGFIGRFIDCTMQFGAGVAANLRQGIYCGQTRFFGRIHDEFLLR